MAKNCRSKNKVQRKQFNVIQRGVHPKEQNPDYATLSWTTCYDDNCSIHLSDKQGLGWFPTRPRRELNVINRKPKLHREEATLTKELEYAEPQICETLRELTPPTTDKDLEDHQG